MNAGSPRNQVRPTLPYQHSGTKPGACPPRPGTDTRSTSSEDKQSIAHTAQMTDSSSATHVRLPPPPSPLSPGKTAPSNSPGSTPACPAPAAAHRKRPPAAPRRPRGRPVDPPTPQTFRTGGRDGPRRWPTSSRSKLGSEWNGNELRHLAWWSLALFDSLYFSCFPKAPSLSLATVATRSGINQTVLQINTAPLACALGARSAAAGSRNRTSPEQLHELLSLVNV